MSPDYNLSPTTTIVRGEAGIAFEALMCWLASPHPKLIYTTKLRPTFNYIL